MAKADTGTVGIALQVGPVQHAAQRADGRPRPATASSPHQCAGAAAPAASAPATAPRPRSTAARPASSGQLMRSRPSAAASSSVSRGNRLKIRAAWRRAHVLQAEIQQRDEHAELADAQRRHRQQVARRRGAMRAAQSRARRTAAGSKSRWRSAASPASAAAPRPRRSARPRWRRPPARRQPAAASRASGSEPAAPRSRRPGPGRRHWSGSLLTSEAARLVDGACRLQVAVGPQHHLAIALGAREGDALVGQPPAQAQAARLGREDQQAQLGDGGRLAHHEHRADPLAVDLGDPALLPGRDRSCCMNLAAMSATSASNSSVDSRTRGQ